jgi:hypothetical protein
MITGMENMQTGIPKNDVPKEEPVEDADETQEEGVDEEPTQSNIQRQPIAWETDEYRHFEKSRDWYWALGLIAVAGAVGSLLFNNILLAVFILIAAFVLAIFAARKPERVTFKITQRGVRVNEKLYPYQNMEAFCIEEQDLNDTDYDKLIFEFKSHFIPDMVIPLEGIDSDEIHDFLLDYLPEEDIYESPVHRFMEALGF